MGGKGRQPEPTRELPLRLAPVKHAQTATDQPAPGTAGQRLEQAIAPRWGGPWAPRGIGEGLGNRCASPISAAAEAVTGIDGIAARIIELTRIAMAVAAAVEQQTASRAEVTRSISGLSRAPMGTGAAADAGQGWPRACRAVRSSSTRP